MKKKTGIFLVILSIVTGYAFFINQEDRAVAKTEQIQLPDVIAKGKISLEEAILKRRSQRIFKEDELSLEQLGQLLWAAQGITGGRYGFSFRTAPSAGALYPIEIYVVTKNGLFHYFPENHKLAVLNQKDLRKSLSTAALGQTTIAQAPVDIVVCVVYARVTQKYGERGIRYTHIEVGHAAQNIHLQAVALGLSSVPIGAFSDEQVKDILSLPDDHEPLYIIPVGYPD